MIKYNRNETYVIDNHQITILDAFQSEAVRWKDKSIYMATFYTVHILPEDRYTVIQERHLDRGDILNYIPTIAGGVASNGNTNKKIFAKQYHLWKDMVYRCYMPNNRVYAMYGARGVRVHPKWMCFEYFMYDYNRLPGSMDAIRDKSGSTWVIDLTDDYVDGTRIDQRQYAPGTCHVVQFARSSIMEAVNYMNRVEGVYNKPRNAASNNTMKFLTDTPENNVPTPVQPPTNMEVKKMDQSKLSMVFDKHIPPTQADYDFMLQDLSFMDKYCKPEEIRSVEVNPVKHLIQPNTTPRAPGMREMCVIAKSRNDPTFDLIERRLRERVKRYEVNN